MTSARKVFRAADVRPDLSRMQPRDQRWCRLERLALIGQRQPPLALIAGLPFAAEQTLGFKAFQLRGQNVAVQLHGAAQLAVGLANLRPEHRQRQVLRTDQAERVWQLTRLF